MFWHLNNILSLRRFYDVYNVVIKCLYHFADGESFGVVRVGVVRDVLKLQYIACRLYLCMQKDIVLLLSSVYTVNNFPIQRGGVLYQVCRQAGLLKHRFPEASIRDGFI